MNKYLAPSLLLFLLILQGSVAPPVTEKKPSDKAQEQEKKEGDSAVNALEDYVQYHHYLKEVVDALESDVDFRSKLEKAEEHEIRSGKIAEELEFVSHHVRTRLDEIKRMELERLKKLFRDKVRLQQKLDNSDASHLDHANPTFEINDLKRLIAKTTADLAEADKKRREEFKEYELHKEFEKQARLNNTNGSEREKLEKEFREKEEKHKKHERLHEPGHKAQLEEVWQEQDQMQQEFDPKTFFMLHDIDSNGLWDENEVKALFVKELKKMYENGHPEDDMRERAEEMERMRESVFQEVDLNRDGFIDFQEFLAQTKRNDYQQDHGWQGLDERKPYTDEELQAYIRAHQQEAYNRQYGYPPPPPGAYHQGVPPGAYHPGAVPPMQQGYHQGGAPVQQQFHPGQVNQQYPQQLPGHLPDLNTNEIYPNQQQQHPPPQGYPQVPQGNYPSQQGHPPPQQQYQNQQPPQAQHQQQQQPPQQYQNQPPPAQQQQQQNLNNNRAPPPQGTNNQPQQINSNQVPPPQGVNNNNQANPVPPMAQVNKV